jgi:hypothetical protein
VTGFSAVVPGATRLGEALWRSGEHLGTKADVGAGRIWFPDEYRGSQKQGKSGPDMQASPEALSSRMREGGNGIDGLESPPRFANQIRTD